MLSEKAMKYTTHLIAFDRFIYLFFYIFGMLLKYIV